MNSSSNNRSLSIDVSCEEPVVKRRVSLRTQALMCHNRLQVEMSPKTDKNIDIENITEEEIEAVVIDQLLTLRRGRFITDMNNKQVYSLAQHIIENRKDEMRTLGSTIDDSPMETIIINDDSLIENGEFEAIRKSEYNVILIHSIIKNELRKRAYRSPIKNHLKMLPEKFKLSAGADEPMALSEQSLNYKASKFSITFNNSKWCTVDCCSTSGERNNMEDRSVALDDVTSIFGFELKDTHHDESNLSFFGIYDGHGGNTSSEYARTHLHANFMRSLQQSIGTDTFLSFEDQVQLVKQALASSFSETDNQFLSLAEELDLSCGTTALVALLLDPSINHSKSSVQVRKLIVANAGDSQCVVSVQGSAKPINRIHRPDEPSEKIRIQEAGGKVFHWYGQARVNGILGVSRAIGDRKYKDLIINTPDIYEFDLEEGLSEFVIMASDGLWDVVTPQEAVDFVHDKRKGSEQNITSRELAKKLVDLAMQRNSKDNVSVILLVFKPFLLELSEEVLSGPFLE